MVELFSVFVLQQYNEIPTITEAVESQLPVGYSHRKFVVEELEVSLRGLSV
jgi:hypothetical protein